MDSGNLSTTTNKLDFITSIYAELGYDAVGIGAMDDRLAADYHAAAAANKLTVLDARPGARDTTVPYIVKDLGGVKVGVVSFGGVTLNPGQDQHEVRTSLYAAYKQARENCDILILLDQANTADAEWLERNSARLGAPDIVVGGVAKTALSEEQIIGRTRVVPTFFQGRALGALDVQFTPGQEPAIKWTRVPLDQDVPEDEEIARRVAEMMLEISKDAGATASAADASRAPARHDAKSYYPPLSCKQCHAEQYEDWVGTKHAKATATLLNARRLIPECLECHSEMWRRAKRIVLPEGQTGGVECATCHFDSLPHGMERKGVVAKTKVDPKMCLDCHTPERSPNYDEATYLPQVSHGKYAR